MKALSTSQERRLVSYIDQALLDLSREFETRRVTTIEAYLLKLIGLQSIILSIPPVAPSSSIRTAYYLQLTNLLPDAFRFYSAPPSFSPLIPQLQAFDNGWRVVLLGLEWDTITQDEKPSSPSSIVGTSTEEREKAAGVTVTDRIRLRSIITECKMALRELRGGPSFVSMKVDPFQRRRLGTPSLISDVEGIETEEESVFEEDEEEDEEDEMDEVEIEGMESNHPLRTREDEIESFDISLPTNILPTTSAYDRTMQLDLPIREDEEESISSDDADEDGSGLEDDDGGVDIVKHLFERTLKLLM